MKTWILTVVIIFGLELGAKLTVLGTGKIPQRNTGTIAFDAFCLVILLAWGIYVLS